MTYCNICGCTEFVNMGPRVNVKCKSCLSLERHRLVRWSLESLGFLDVEISYGKKRALHLAPEAMTHQYLLPVFGSGYVCSDLQPENFPHAECLKLPLPDGFSIFPNNYFDLIVHNHVLEHIPGDFRDHVASFTRIMRKGGSMLFSVPSIKPYASIQGGEYLSSDEDRIRLHGQSDHYKTFGCDFIEYMSEIDGCFMELNIPAQIRESLQAKVDPIFLFTK